MYPLAPVRVGGHLDGGRQRVLRFQLAVGDSSSHRRRDADQRTRDHDHDDRESDHHERGRLAAAQHEVADRELLGGQMLGDTLVHVLVVAAEQRDLRLDPPRGYFAG